MEEKFYERSFLNSAEHGGIALIEATVNELLEHNDGTKSVDASLTFGDCSRQVNIDFSSYSVDDVRNARQKITRLRRSVCRFEKMLLLALDEVEESR